jgi:HAD superfamily hydrolase (TIGR01549 family)
MGKEVFRLKGLIFDCDGVLIDSREANRRFYDSILRQMGLPGMSVQQVDYVHTRTVSESIEHIVPRHRLDEALEIASGMGYEEVLPYIRLEPGLIEFLQALADRGIRRAVNTNRTGTMELILERFQLASYFSPVMTAMRLSNAKPHPESVQRILSDWGLPLEQVAYLGDSEVDEQTAGAAGVAFWAYKNRDLKAERFVSDFRSLQQELGSL